MSSHESGSSRPTKRRRKLDPKAESVRRATLLTRVHERKQKGIKVTVDFDDKGQPEGEFANEFLSYLGILGRDVPITTKDWRNDKGIEILKKK